MRVEILPLPISAMKLQRLEVTLDSKWTEHTNKDRTIILTVFFLFVLNSENYVRLQIFFEDLSLAKTINEESYKVTTKITGSLILLSVWMVLLIQNLYLFRKVHIYSGLEELRGRNTFQFYTWKPQLWNYLLNKIHFVVPRAQVKSDRFLANINWVHNFVATLWGKAVFRIFSIKDGWLLTFIVSWRIQ